MPYNHSEFFPEKSQSWQPAFPCKAQPGKQKSSDAGDSWTTLEQNT